MSRYFSSPSYQNNLHQRISRHSLPCASLVDQGAIHPPQIATMTCNDVSGTKFVDPAERMIRMQDAQMRRSATRSRLTRSRRYWSSSIVRILAGTRHKYTTDSDLQSSSRNRTLLQYHTPSITVISWHQAELDKDIEH